MYIHIFTIMIMIVNMCMYIVQPETCLYYVHTHIYNHDHERVCAMYIHWHNFTFINMYVHTTSIYIHVHVHTRSRCNVFVHLESCTPGTRQYKMVCTGTRQYVPYSIQGHTRNLKMVHTSTYQHRQFLWQYILVCTGMHCLVTVPA